MQTCFNVNARSIINSVEFHRVDTSGISSSPFILAAIHCCLNRSRRCGEALIFITSLRSFNITKLVSCLINFNCKYQ